MKRDKDNNSIHFYAAVTYFYHACLSFYKQKNCFLLFFSFFLSISRSLWRPVWRERISVNIICMHAASIHAINYTSEIEPEWVRVFFLSFSLYLFFHWSFWICMHFIYCCTEDRFKSLRRIYMNIVFTANISLSKIDFKKTTEYALQLTEREKGIFILRQDTINLM